MKKSDLKVGRLIEGFEIISIDPLPELNNVMVQLKHQKTGALMAHLDNDDDNNCFGVAFRTIPRDSTGIAHILEHTALCGSKKFPVRDPFFSMLKRSMKTFMNALTASDWTMYPFSTQNEVDFFNLLDVYMDAAFSPLLSEVSFKQEGHRLEFKEPENPDSPLTVRGVVYSEMQGAMSAQSSVMHDSVGKALFPNIAYKYNSGGDPEEIAGLSLGDLKRFHKLHYHPSNSLFYVYGNIPLGKKLKAINRVISKFEKADVDSSIPDEQRYSSPKEFVFRYQLNEGDNDGRAAQVALSWLACNIREPLEVLSLRLVSLILLGHSGAELRKRLLESRLGKSLSDIVGFEDETRETYFSAGLQGVAPEDANKVEELIMSSIKEIADRGIKPEQIETAIHQMELGAKEITGGHYPYSLNLLFRFFGPWAHGGDLVENLSLDRSLELLKAKIEQGPFLENQIRKYLIENPHRVKVTLLPDAGLEKERSVKLEKSLEKIRSGLSEREKVQIVEDAAALKAYQEKKEDISVLPALKVSDIPPEIKYIPPFKEGLKDLDVTFYDRFTNGLLYVNWYFKLDGVTEEERKWLPLAGYLLGKTGAGGLSYEELAEKISLSSGGFGASPIIETSLKDKLNCQEFFCLSGKALERNAPKMFDLGKMIVNEWDFSDTERIRVLVSQRANNMATSLIQSGHAFAAGLASRNLGPVSLLEETYSGVYQLRLMKEVAEADEKGLSQIIEKLDDILRRVFSKEKASALAVGEKGALEAVEPLMEDFISGLQKEAGVAGSGSLISLSDFKVSWQKEAWLTTTPLSYVAHAFQTAAFPHEDAPGLMTLSYLLRSCFLHSEIREKGGAYGGMAGYNASEGIFTMASYRDPRLAETISVYEKALSWAKEGNFSEQEVEESILQTCSSLDVPKSPFGKAVAEYVSRRRGVTKELREQFRLGILKCRKSDLMKLADKYLDAPCSIAAITGEAALQRDWSLMADKGFDKREI